MDALKMLAERLFEKRADEDIVDKVNNSVTPFVLLSCAIIVFAKEYAEFNSEWMEYVHDFCFVESTYYVPFNNTFCLKGPSQHSPQSLWHRRRRGAVHYGGHWPSLQRRSVAQLKRFEAGGQKVTTVQDRISHLIRTTFARNYLAVLYLFTKLLYFVFLRVNKLPNWGFAVLNSFMTHGSSWEHNGLFPRVTLCDLKICRPDEHFLEFTVQCVLVANFDGEESEQQQHGRAVVSNATAKTNLSDAQSGTSSNSSTARAEEMAFHSNDLLSGSAGGSRAEDKEG
uniref:Innexin n=1 Tax=Globodera pallida TaxID=36090 RepID=A0A183CLP5_GLOPA